MRYLVLMICMIATQAQAWDLTDPFGEEKKRKAEAIIRSDKVDMLKKYDAICKTKLAQSLPRGVVVLDWYPVMDVEDTSTGKKTGVFARALSGGGGATAICYTDQSDRIIDFGFRNLD